jgi:CDP-diacylglycerol--glycerol-3-phosphate 3-phosphatidyltransferase
MTFLHIIPAWLVIIFILRDTVVDAYRMSAIKKNINVAANMLGKLKTTFQMIGLIIIFFVWNSTTIYEHSPLHYYIAQNFVMMVACCFSIASGIVYIYKFSTYKNV